MKPCPKNSRNPCWNLSSAVWPSVAVKPWPRRFRKPARNSRPAKSVPPRRRKSCARCSCETPAAALRRLCALRPPICSQTSRVRHGTSVHARTARRRRLSSATQDPQVERQTGSLIGVQRGLRLACHLPIRQTQGRGSRPHRRHRHARRGLLNLQTLLSLLKWHNRGRDLERRKDIGDLLRKYGAKE